MGCDNIGFDRESQSLIVNGGRQFRTDLGEEPLLMLDMNAAYDLPDCIEFAAPLSPMVAGALLIGVDLGPNLSVTGSLATILWLVALRREGLDIGASRFFRIGTIVMAPALLLALAGLVGVHFK